MKNASFYSSCTTIILTTLTVGAFSIPTVAMDKPQNEDVSVVEPHGAYLRKTLEGLDNHEMVAVLQTRDVIQAHDIRDVCSERLDRLDAKIQSVKEFSQEMKILERNRQNQRGMEM